MRRAYAALPQPSQRALCAALGLPLSWRATVARAMNGVGPVSLEAENHLRARLGLPALIPPAIPVPPCVDCGSVHHARCYGRPVEEVVVLAPGERVVRPAARPRRRPHYWRPCLPPLSPEDRQRVADYAMSLYVKSQITSRGEP